MAITVIMTGMNKIVPKQHSAITQSNPAVTPPSSNSRSNNTNILSHPFHPIPLINHLSVSTTSATDSASSNSSSKTGRHHHSTSTCSFPSSNGRHHHSIYGKGHPNGNTSKHHEYGGGGGYVDYPSYRGHCS